MERCSPRRDEWLGKQIPVMGVNFGRLGFLASFTPEQFKDQFEAFIENKLPISSRLMVEASVVDAGAECNLVDARWTSPPSDAGRRPR